MSNVEGYDFDWSARLVEKGFDPNQPRHPKGSSEGGRWKDDDTTPIVQVPKGSARRAKMAEISKEMERVAQELGAKVRLYPDYSGDSLLVNFSGGFWSSVRLFYYDLKGNLAVNHDTMMVDVSDQSKGIAKKFLSELMDAYEKVGISRINIETVGTGSYAWLRFGFKPSDPSGGFMDQMIVNRLDALLEDSHVPVDVANVATSALEAGDYWALSDLRYPVGKQPLGYVLMESTSWSGSLNLKDPEAMARFNAYTGRVKKIFDESKVRRVRGGPGGGQFTNKPKTVSAGDKEKIPAEYLIRVEVEPDVWITLDRRKLGNRTPREAAIEIAVMEGRMEPPKQPEEEESGDEADASQAPKLTEMTNEARRSLHYNIRAMVHTGKLKLDPDLVARLGSVNSPLINDPEAFAAFLADAGLDTIASPPGWDRGDLVSIDTENRTHWEYAPEVGALMREAYPTGLTEEESWAFGRYAGLGQVTEEDPVGDSWKDINNYLRNGTKTSADNVKAAELLRDSVFKKAKPINQDTMVWRIGRFDNLTQGYEFVDDGVVSTAFMKQQLGDHFSGKGKKLVQIRIPEGTKVLSNKYDYLGEIVLAPGTKFRVAKGGKAPVLEVVNA